MREEAKLAQFAGLFESSYIAGAMLSELTHTDLTDTLQACRHVASAPPSQALVLGSWVKSRGTR